MKTVNNILHQMTDPKTIMAEIRETLRTIDPQFFDAEIKYMSAASNLEKELGGSIMPSVSEFLAAEEEAFVAEIIYIGWQGFQLNMDIFNAPINAIMLRGDYEELHRESRLGTLPMAKKARDIIDAFYKVMQESYKDKLELTVDITSFYSYLQTTGYKIAHYFGFRLAEQFLPYVIPDYVADRANTGYYRKTLQAYLDVDLGRMEE